MAVVWTGPSSDSPRGADSPRGMRKALLGRPSDEAALIELKARIAEADSSQSWIRARMDSWRRWHNNHYTPRDRQAARRQTVGSQLVPAEPLLMFPRIESIAEEYVERYRRAGLESRFVPRSRTTPSENVAVMNGIAKRIDSDGNMEAAELAAFKEAVLYGYSCIAYETAYEAESVDPETELDVGAYDQIIRPWEIDRAEWTVLWDPTCRRRDKSDADWCAVRKWMTRDEFARAYPRAARKLTGMAPGSEATQGTGGPTPALFPARTADLGGGDPWYRNRGGEEELHVVVFFRSERTPMEVTIGEDGQVMMAPPEPDEPPAPAPDDDEALRSVQPPSMMDAPLQGEPGFESDWGKAPAAAETLPVEDPPDGSRRKIDVRRVERIVACGEGIIERTYVPGNVIPIIPLYGHEMVSDTEGIWHHGLIYKLGDLLKALENVASQVTGYIGRAAKALFLVPEGGTGADPDAWDTLHAVNRNYITFRTTPPGGPNSGQPPLPPPQAMQIQINVQGQVDFMRQLQEEIMRESGTIDVPSTQDSSHDRSAQSILRLNQIGEDRNRLYLRNMATTTLKRKGQILARMIPAIYDRPGRMVYVKGANPGDKDKPVYLNAPYVEGDGDDGPVLVPQDQRAAAIEAGEWADPEAPPGPDGQPAAAKKVHFIDLRKGTLDATVHIGSREKANRQEAINTIATLLPQEGVFDQRSKPVAAAQMVSALSQDLPELGPVVQIMRQTISDLHPEGDMGRDAVLARLHDAQNESAQKDEQIATLQAEADKLRAVRDVASIQAQSGIEKEALRGQTATVLEGIKQEGAAQSDERKAGAALELAALKAAFEERLAKMQGQIDMLHTGFEKGLEGAEAAAADVQDTGKTQPGGTDG